MRIFFSLLCILIAAGSFAQEGKAELDHSFKGGSEMFRYFLSDKLKYPESARRNGTVGTSILNFRINCETNQPFDFRFETNLHDGVEEAVIDAITATAGQWSACSMNENQRIRIKIGFSINDKSYSPRDTFVIINAVDFSNDPATDAALLKRMNKAIKKQKHQRAEKYLDQMIARYPDKQEYLTMKENFRN